MRRFFSALLASAVAVAPASALSPVQRATVLAGKPSWVLSGASADCDFTQSRCWTGGPNSTAPSSVLSVSRASTGYAQWADGHWSSFGNNTLRNTDQGALIEEARTNGIRNNSMQGAVAGTPGTRPTNWPAFTLAGLTQTIVGTGTFNGVDYIDVQFSGTTTVSTGIFINMEANNQIAALSGQTWAQSMFLQIVGGDLTNIGTQKMRISERDSSGTGLQADDTVISVTSTWTRFASTGTLSNVSTAFIQPEIVFGAASGVPINFTLRIGWPQLELGAFATSPIRTTSAPVARAADVITLSGPALTAAPNAHAARVETNFIEGINQNGTFVYFNPQYLRLQASGAGPQMNNGITLLSATFGSGSYTGLTKSAFSFDASSYTAVGNGGTLATQASAWGAMAASTYVGSQAGTSRWLNGYLRRLTFSPAKGQFDGSTN